MCFGVVIVTNYSIPLSSAELNNTVSTHHAKDSSDQAENKPPTVETEEVRHQKYSRLLTISSKAMRATNTNRCHLKVPEKTPPQWRQWHTRSHLKTVGAVLRRLSPWRKRVDLELLFNEAEDITIGVPVS